MDIVYTHISKLVTPQQILAADLQIYPVCFPGYMHKWKEAKQKENSQSKDTSFLRCLKEIFQAACKNNKNSARSRERSLVIKNKRYGQH